MKTDKIAVMLKKNQERQNLHWRITNKGKMFAVNGLWYDESFLEQMFPKYELPTNRQLRKQNCTRIWKTDAY